MSDFAWESLTESLTPWQRLVLGMGAGQMPAADAAGRVGPMLPGAGGPPRPQGEAPSIVTYGLPANLLRGGGVIPAQRALATPQTSLPDRAEAAGLAPMPPVPDYTSELGQYGQALQDQAHSRVTQQDLSAAEAGARASGFRAGLQALPTFDPADAAYRWSAVVPQSLGALHAEPLPTRPAPGHSALAAGLAALAGLVDPRAAGSFSAAPLQAGIEAANTQYNDRLRQFAQAQEQRNAQYAAARADAEQANRFALVNAEATEGAAVRARQAQDEAALRSAPYVSGAADAAALATNLPDLADRERTSLEGGAAAAAILEKINLTDKQYAQALEAARYTNNPLARIQVETLRQQGFYYRALLRKLESSGAGSNGGGGGANTQVAPAVVRPPVPTPSSPSGTRSPAMTATPPGRPATAPKSRFAPANPNAPTTSIR